MECKETKNRCLEIFLILLLLLFPALFSGFQFVLIFRRFPFSFQLLGNCRCKTFGDAESHAELLPADFALYNPVIRGCRLKSACQSGIT